MRILNLGSLVVNTYLVEINNGWLLVDTGYQEGFGRFVHGLTKHGLNCKDIKYIFLTHVHDDHAGFLNELLGCCDASVILHKNAVEVLRRGQNCFDGGCTGRLALGFCNLMTLFGKGAHRFPPIEGKYESRYLIITENTRADLERELSARIIETPGHTRCSISLLLENGLLFCGDAAMNGFPSVHRTTIWAEDMEAYVSSWEKIISLSPYKIYPGHGRPFPPADLKRYLPKAKSKRLPRLI
jgi:glyoxylase-like metal-dependent hydrolase (beta-lactamase superfamily II)